MLAGDRTIVFLVGKSKLRFSEVEYIVRDFYEDKKQSGKVFSFCELRELIKMLRNPNYFYKSFMFKEVLPYVLPFLEEESFKSIRSIDD